jgi:hypothetical protein
MERKLSGGEEVTEWPKGRLSDGEEVTEWPKGRLSDCTEETVTALALTFAANVKF